jgi:excisionase family DNA binding protein
MSKQTEQKILNLLTEIRDKISTESDEPLTLPEAAAFLHIAKQTVYLLTSRRKIPFSKANGKLWFKKSDLRQFVLSNRHESVDMIVDELRGK